MRNGREGMRLDRWKRRGKDDQTGVRRIERRDANVEGGKINEKRKEGKEREGENYRGIISLYSVFTKLSRG